MDEGQGRGWLTAEYSMLPGSTSPRKRRDRGGKLDGRTSEIQRLIGRSLRAIIDLAPSASGRSPSIVTFSKPTAARGRSITGGIHRAGGRPARVAKDLPARPTRSATAWRPSAWASSPGGRCLDLATWRTSAPKWT